MKRPQFGLRLTLLVVALFAAIFAWRAAVQQQRREERSGELMSVQLTVKYLEQFQANHPETGQIEFPFPVKRVSTEIAGLKKQIEELSK